MEQARLVSLEAYSLAKQQNTEAPCRRQPSQTGGTRQLLSPSTYRNVITRMAIWQFHTAWCQGNLRSTQGLKIKSPDTGAVNEPETGCISPAHLTDWT